ncbi:ABC transporter permease [Nakamurella leprariae]|uniref:ABC transporter permease n=1 Tax=Nakamurella leprariae TaxID=2803911 RepID=A0A939BZU4_9ACTN|nr:ABC transporter permease [Nakamurella leprariae]MBM9468535.1 ABC transporter permease [Nakamurella leprariae]
MSNITGNARRTDPAGPAAPTEHPATTVTARKPDEGPRARRLLRRLGRTSGPLAGLIVLVVVMSILSPVFLTTHNLVNILVQVSYVGIMAAGATLVIILGGIDLSVSSTLGLSFMIVAVLYAQAGWPFPLAVLAGLLLGTLIGVMNGVMIAYGGIQPFIATLATMFASTGLALYVTNGTPILGFPDWFQALSRTRFIGISLQVYLMLFVFAAAAIWLRFRPAGRSLYAIGGNEEVARLSGIRVRSLQLRVYAVAGFLAAVAGLVVGARLDAAQPTAGNSTDLLNVIAAVVIGGASLAGGVGTMWGTFLGLLIIGVVNNGLTLLNVSPNLQPVVIGAVIILAVLGDGRLLRTLRHRRGRTAPAA